MRRSPDPTAELREGNAPSRFMLGGIVAFTLLLACANPANLLLARASARRREICVRLALGAGGRGILASVIGRIMGPVLIGLVGGIALARLLGGTISGFMYGVSPTDPWTIGLVGTLLAMVAILASLLPARRATRVDPTVALRAD